MISRHAGADHTELRLHGIRLVDDDHPAPRRGGGSLGQLGRRALPRAEVLPRERQRRVGRDVARHGQVRAAGRVPIAVEGRDVFTRERRHRPGIALALVGVRVIAVGEATRDRGAEIRGVVVRDLQTRQGLPAPALDLVVGERGPLHDVGEELEAGLERGGHHGDRHLGRIGPGVRRQRSADPIDGFRNLLRRARRRPLSQQLRSHRRESRLRALVARGARARHHERRSHHRLPVVANHEHGEAVLELRFRVLRERERALRRWRGWLLPGRRRPGGLQVRRGARLLRGGWQRRAEDAGRREHRQK
jgi:hypothetical protein